MARVYLQTKIVASVTLPRPSDRDVLHGKLPGSWVDAVSIAAAAGLQVDDVNKRLGDLIYAGGN